MQDFGFQLLLLMYSPRPSPIIEIVPGGSFFCALCISVFHHLWDTSGHNWWYLPLVWLLPHKHKHTHTRCYTHIHIYTDTHGHTAAHTDTLIFNGIIYSLTRPPHVHEHVSAVTYCCCLLSIHVQPVIRKSDRSSFIHRVAHEWSRHTVLNTNKDSRAEI